MRCYAFHVASEDHTRSAILRGLMVKQATSNEQLQAIHEHRRCTPSSSLPKTLLYVRGIPWDLGRISRHAVLPIAAKPHTKHEVRSGFEFRCSTGRSDQMAAKPSCCCSSIRDCPSILGDGTTARLEDLQCARPRHVYSRSATARHPYPHTATAVSSRWRDYAVQSA